MSSAVASPAHIRSARQVSARPPVVPAALALLTQARRGLADAERQTAPVERFTAAYSSALRAAAAVLAARGRPHRGRSRPTSVWTLLPSAAPELGEWATFFAAHSGLQAAAQAGIAHRISARTADDLLRQAEQFVDLTFRATPGAP
ncbi:MAG: SAV_6107 family HEPN domain-containing protein [Pseudonocardiaceae bacterium]